jgi:hypothetical protein
VATGRHHGFLLAHCKCEGRLSECSSEKDFVSTFSTYHSSQRNGVQKLAHVGGGVHLTKAESFFARLLAVVSFDVMAVYSLAFSCWAQWFTKTRAGL